MQHHNLRENLKVAALVEDTITQGQGHLSDTGALIINTGKFTGRSPKDRFIVEDDITRDTVDWGKINIPIGQEAFDQLLEKTLDYAQGLDAVYVRDAYACASRKYRINIRVYTEYPWQNMFAYNMFLRPDDERITNLMTDEWTIYAFPGVKADPAIHGTRQDNFSIINFTKKTILIGGTAYTGEIKKGIFSVLNYVLPTRRDVLSMHCSANVGAKGDTALFFGLSGTGKTTLSNDPDRRLIGDDEHGWSQANVFNLEGGCYAKVIDLSESKEPQIYRAIKFGALLENIVLKEDGHTPDYADDSITQNTRVSYPIDHIENIMYNSRGDLPRNIFFLTCDAFGVLPPISKLTPEQAMYHFISGYTAKIAGTETGITEPQPNFSACFGAPFIPLHPTHYADMLGNKLKQADEEGEPINVWLVNTGWTGGGYGEGSRIELAFTRAMIKAALTGALDDVDYVTDPVFGLSRPTSCPDVPNAILNPRDTWRNEQQYDAAAEKLAKLFHDNFANYAKQADKAIVNAGPE
ncbi:phosphoenolpyruvate carboxykinase (ATP) [Lewinella marina]|uniref:Phosphoenolpyruvate carboxykinase (ATP) n=1 Tax=Neolewinella marina TaxID=438751 RepID=A0A2G0CJB3_9BACT|nr:phosphoenolpyruvate carboxykinase (ATP) [Neolewinella marina]NJB84775.1 phosphoenolpyruvate carboxykinase (ATP) [Neolewinella marina]PHL00066.1 phosphoenolpyruvate carboxykinase (ATP) [Neolewinella marina]